MATYYVNASASGTAGNDSANGTTTTTPWLTLGKLNDNVASGDTVYLSGDFYATGEGISINGLSNVTLAQWSGMPQWWICGSVLTTPGSWTVHAGTTYKYTVASTVVGFGYGLSDAAFRTGISNSDGTPNSLVQKATSLVNCIATANTWWWESSVLYFNGDGLDPSDGTEPWEYCLSGLTTVTNGIQMQGCTNCTVSGIYFRYLVAAASSNYFIIGSGSGNVITDCVGYYCGRHHFGFVDSGTGINTNNTIRRCKMYGGGVDATAGTQSVFYCDDFNVIGALVEDCEFYTYQAYDITGSLFNSSVNQDGGYSHTAGATTVTDITYRRCYFKCFTGANNRWIDFGNPGVVPSFANGWTRSAYGNIVSDCTFENAGTPVARTLPVGTWFERCVFLCGNAGSIQQPSSGTGQTMLSACHVTAPKSAGGRLIGIIDSSAANYTDIFLMNTSVVNTSTNSTNAIGVVTGTGGRSRISAHNCIFQPRTGGSDGVLLAGDGSIATANLDFANNWYAYVGTYSAAASRDTQAEWAATVDTETDSDYTTIPGWLSATTSPQPSAKSASGLPRITDAEHEPTVGFNAAAFSDNFGPWQYGVVYTSSGSVKRPIYIFGR